MASWATPTVFATGDILDVISANTWSSDVAFLYEKPYAYAYLSAQTDVTYTVEQVPLDALAHAAHDFTLSASVVTVPLAGVYQVNFGVQLNTSNLALTSYLWCALYQNGSLMTQGGSTQSSGAQVVGSSLVSANAGDTLGLWFYPNTTATVTMAPGAPHTFLSAAFVGSQ